LEYRNASRGLSSFEKAIWISPYEIMFLNFTGRILVQLERHRQAILQFHTILTTIDPDYNDALLGKAIALDKSDQSNDSVRYCDKILSRFPNDALVMALKNKGLSTTDNDAADNEDPFLLKVSDDSITAHSMKRKCGYDPRNRYCRVWK
jgi:tetratricopeptide (TPR) repeat protein